MTYALDNGFSLRSRINEEISRDDLVKEGRMLSDFHDAHERHWDDAEIMFNDGRWANSDHLHGISAECGLKCLMLKFGMQMDPLSDRPSDGRDRKHANGIWDRYSAYRSGPLTAVKYDIPPTNPFHDWDIGQRYAHRGNFDLIRASRHRQGAELVRALSRQALLDGLIP